MQKNAQHDVMDIVPHVLNVFAKLRELRGMDAILDRILLEARKLCRAEAGTIFLVKGDRMVFSIVHNDLFFNADGINKHIYSNASLPIDDNSIAGYTANRSETLVIDDVYALDPSYPFCFNTSLDQQSGYRTRSMLSLPLINFQGRVCAVLQLINALSRGGTPNRFSPESVSCVSLLANHASACIETGITTNEMILRTMRMAALRDPAETATHVQRVGAYAAEIYHRIALDRGVAGAELKRRKDMIRVAAMLHDVGKVGIEDAILKKPGRLSPDEFEIMKRHAQIGAFLFRRSTSELDIMAGDIALNHHQRFDGKGYPGWVADIEDVEAPTIGRMAGKEIPLPARIVALADVFDALVSRRTYKEPWSMEDALDVIRGESGRQFDPDVVAAFFSILDVIEAIREKYQDVALDLAGIDSWTGLRGLSLSKKYSQAQVTPKCGSHAMPIADERRKRPRSLLEESFLCIMQAKGLACNLDTCAKETLHVFVDVTDCSECGAHLQVPFQLPEGAMFTLSMPDNATGQWMTRAARIVWSRTDASGDFCSGIEYLDHDHGCQPLSMREADPRKPAPADLSFLLHAALFQAVSRKGLCLLLNTLHKTTVSAGERIISRGEPGECLYLIQKGTCVVFVEQDAAVQRIARLKQGDVVGEMAVLTGEPRTANVDAETNMVLWKLAGSQFDALAESHPDLRLFLTEIMANRFDSSVFVGDRTIGKYVLSNKIGQGGWGIVYRGMHKLLKMPVAVKMMKHDMAMDPEFLENFRQEAEIIARMRHPNIVSVYDIEEIYKTIFIIMEYLEGVSLKELMERVGPMPAERCVNILLQVCDGLACAHVYNIIHRDIKPANIILLEQDLVKLLDFGLACAPGTEDMDIPGTVYYAPPEQIEGRPVDFRSDIYAMGMMAYEMACGERPFPENSLAEIMDMHCNLDIPDPWMLVPELPRQFRDFIIKCCRRDPQERYHSMQQAKNELLAARGEYPLPLATAAERGVKSLLLVHSSEQEQALKILLEDFGNKAAELGVSLLLSEFKNV